MATTWRQDDFRFRNDDGNQANATWKENVHINHTAVLSGSTYKFRIRIAASEQGSTAGTLTAYLYAQKNGAGGYTRVTAARADGLKVVDSTNLTDNEATTQQISAVTFVAGKVDDVDGTCTATASIARYSGTEHEFMLQIDAASVNDGDYFDIREYNSTTQFTTYTYTPRITVSKPVELTSAGGISSAEALGTPEISTPIELTGAGNITSVETIGTPVAKLEINPSGIASSETCGQADIQLALSLSGISSIEAFGTPTVAGQTEAVELTNAGNIAGAEAFGSQTVCVVLTTTGMPGAETIGSPNVESAVVSFGIASLEQLGSPGISLSVSTNGVAGQEAFGTPIVEAESGEKNLYPAGISSLEAFGTAAVEVESGGQNLFPAGISSQEAFGLAVISLIYPPIPTPDVRKGRLNYSRGIYHVPAERYEKVKAK